MYPLQLAAREPLETGPLDAEAGEEPGAGRGDVGAMLRRWARRCAGDLAGALAIMQPVRGCASG